MKTATDPVDEKVIHAVHTAIRVMQATLETIREFGRAPESAIFLACSARGMGLGGYERMKATLIGTGLVRVECNEFVWVGTELHPPKAGK